MEAAWLASDADAPAGPAAARRRSTAGDDAGGDSRGRQSAALLVVREGAGYGGLDDIAVDLRVDDHADPVAELARLLDLNDLYLTASTEDEKVPVTPELEAELEEFAQALGHATSTPGSAPRTTRCGSPPTGAGSTSRILEIVRGQRHRQRVSVLAIDAGTTGVTAVVVDRRRADRGQGLPGVRPALPAAGLGGARARGDLAGDARGDPRGARHRSTPSQLRGGRHHQPARDDPALGPRDAGLAAAGDRLAGPAYRRHLRPAARRGSRGAGHRADRAAAGPLLLRHQADLAGRARAAHLGAGRVGPLRRSAPSTPT